MIRLKIDNTELEAPEGTTVFNVAKKAGINIPTLCHKEGLPHYTSCFICIVKDKQTDRYIPSCSALVHDGMDIDTSGEEVIAMRKKAIELLLYEHRAECEAPCRVVCPAELNIPLMNRLAIAGDIEGVKELSQTELTGPEILCTTCPGYCENACRRKKVDTPVSIRNIQLFVFKSINKDNIIQNADDQLNKYSNEVSQAKKTRTLKKRFSSRIGKLGPPELNEWLKECKGDGTRCREISGFDDLVREAENCMHCDCRAAEDCRLRELAEEYSVKDPRGKIISNPIEKKINQQTGLIFENAKCIKCGLCVRICEDDSEMPALCFLNRGFITILSEPLTATFEDILKTKSDEVINICPTGALSKFNE